MEPHAPLTERAARARLAKTCASAISVSPATCPAARACTRTQPSNTTCTAARFPSRTLVLAPNLNPGAEVRHGRRHSSVLPVQLALRTDQVGRRGSGPPLIRLAGSAYELGGTVSGVGRWLGLAGRIRGPLGFTQSNIKWPRAYRHNHRGIFTNKSNQMSVGPSSFMDIASAPVDDTTGDTGYRGRRDAPKAKNTSHNVTHTHAV